MYGSYWLCYATQMLEYKIRKIEFINHHAQSYHAGYKYMWHDIILKELNWHFIETTLVWLYCRISLFCVILAERHAWISPADRPTHRRCWVRYTPGVSPRILQHYQWSCWSHKGCTVPPPCRILPWIWISSAPFFQGVPIDIEMRIVLPSWIHYRLMHIHFADMRANILFFHK